MESTEKTELPIFRKELSRTLNTLMASKLSQGRAKQMSVYALPWFMLIGPPGSGKTALIENADMDFTFLDIPDSGISSSDKCSDLNWWFTRDAILADPSGDFVFNEEKSDLWDEFLHFFTVNRKKQPIDGVILAVRITDFISAESKDIEQLAGNIRMRIDQMIDRFGTRFPVFMVITACDEIQGFKPFFDYLKKESQAQFWGYFLTPEDLENPRPELIFRREFTGIENRLITNRMACLDHLSSLDDRQQAFAFPSSFATYKDGFVKFVQQLFQHNPYKEDPLFKGFFFTSSPPSQEQPAYFSKQIFSNLVADPDRKEPGPDEPALAPSDKPGLLKPIWGISLAVMILGLIWMGISYTGNKQLIRDIRIRASAVHDPDQTPEQTLAKMVSLKETLERLNQYDTNGVPLQLGLGFFRGHKLNPLARSKYYDRFDQLALTPAGTGLEQDMWQLIRNKNDTKPVFEKAFSLLKTYLTLTTRSAKIDRDFMDTFLAGKAYFLPHLSQKTLSACFSFYLSEFGKPDLPYLEQDPALVEAMKEFIKDLLSQFPPAREIYHEIIEEGTPRFSAVNWDFAASAFKDRPYTGSYEFSGLYTAKAWKTFVNDEIRKKAGERIRLPDGSSLGAKHEIKDLIRSVQTLYAVDYVDHWRRFFASVTMLPFQNYKTAVQVFSEHPMVLNQLLGVLFDNIKPDNIPLDGENTLAEIFAREFNTVATLFEGAGHKFKHPDLIAYFTEASRLENEMRLLDREDKEGDLSKKTAAAQLDETSEKRLLSPAWEKASAIRKSLSGTGNEAFSRLITLPLEQAWRLILKITQDRLVYLFKQSVCPEFKSNLASLYPFDPAGKDPGPEEIDSFFHPRSGFFWDFYNREMAPFLFMKNDTLVSATWIDMGLEPGPGMEQHLVSAHRLTQGLYPDGNNLHVAFEIYCVPISGVRQILLTVDGNTFDYRNQPQMWNPLKWPGKTDKKGVSISINGEKNVSASFEGWLGFLKMLEAMAVVPEAQGVSSLGLKMNPYQLTYKVRTKTEGDIFRAIKEFKRFTCVLEDVE